MEVHTVLKANNRQHAIFSIPSSSAKELAPSSVRVRPQLISLSSNNLTYARLGTPLKWWDAYPVPATSPEPYDLSWGIVPAWGYATVLESTTSIAPGTTLWGYWPTVHRQGLMSYYNRYVAVGRDGEIEREQMAWTAALKGVWVGGYLLSEYIFAPIPQTQTPIHPLGASFGLPWTADDADISSAVVISLAAATKTARFFAYNLARRPASTEPLGLVQVTSAPSAISAASENLSPKYATTAVSYSDLDQAAPWIADLKPSKLVIVDFGGRDNFLSNLHELIKSDRVLKSCKIVVMQVGGQQKIYTDAEEIEERLAMDQFAMVQFNTSTVQDTALERHGASAYFTAVEERWNKWLQDQPLSAPDLRLV